jgi:hypothetical protein
MAAGGETFAILTFLVGSGVAIAFLDWLLGGVGEAFGIEETPWGDVVQLPREMHAAAKSFGEGEVAGEMRRRADANTQEEPFQVPLGGSL